MGGNRALYRKLANCRREQITAGNRGFYTPFEAIIDLFAVLFILLHNAQDSRVPPKSNGNNRESLPAEATPRSFGAVLDIRRRVGRFFYS